MSQILYKDLSYTVVGAAMEVHRILGPGFLEAVYHRALMYELSLQGVRFEAFKHLPLSYKGRSVGEYQADLVVEDKMIVEIKAVSRLSACHDAQALHYLAATGLRLAILLNFGGTSLEQRRVVR